MSENIIIKMQLLVLLISGFVCLSAQQVVTREFSNAEKMFQLAEIGGLVSEEDDGLSFQMVLPADHRESAYKDIDVREGDLLLMFNGQRVRSVDELRERYQAVAVGELYKIGLQRNERLFIATINKADPAKKPKMQFRTMEVGGDNAGMTVVPELGAILNQTDQGLIVQLLPIGDRSALPDIKADDRVVRIAGTTVKTVAEFEEKFAGFAAGDKLTLGIERGDKSIDITFEKPEAPKNMMIRRRQE